MRIFYVFNIKKEVYDIYKETPSVLYNFFYQLYYLNNNKLDYGNTVFKQIANIFNKEKMDLKIYLLLHNKMIYSKRNEEHIINNLFKNEISILKIKKSYILLNTNSNYSYFFNIIFSFYKESFVCDFINQDYFFISDLKMLV